MKKTMTIILLGLCAGGCADRTYLTKSHGRANSQAFGRQAVAPKPRLKVSGPDATEGLDSQEASAVARSYRDSLSGKEGAAAPGGQAMVITNPGAAQAAPYMPGPSVPNSQ
ncbi:MAG: hypothetical protein H7X95_01110 [Deltaproteobacteria bacterium]|nr:hypothetical protein [Deltaproteobacteria bacterium]